MTRLAYSNKLFLSKKDAKQNKNYSTILSSNIRSRKQQLQIMQTVFHLICKLRRTADYQSTNRIKQKAVMESVQSVKQSATNKNFLH